MGSPLEFEWYEAREDSAEDARAKFQIDLVKRHRLNGRGH